MYQIGILIYITLFRFVALFHKKAGKMAKGHRNTWTILRDKMDQKKDWLWFHASSLGEFEQGRPIMEQIRADHPEYGIIVTFYSPSGYEVRKNYAGADIICYLPFDTRLNSKRFLNLVRPKMAFFIKYEFWPNYLCQLKKRNIPTYLISGIFRPNQAFFKKYAGPYRALLNNFTHFFLQDQKSVDLLESIGYVNNVSISGDTRFDRVLEIQDHAKILDIAIAFSQKNSNPTEKIMVAGSSWPKDEMLFIPYFNEHPELKLIIAPHEIHEDHLLEIEAQLNRPFQRYTNTSPEEAAKCDCLIIDCFGLLSSIYQYGDLAYIGGGFGSGIHNTLEAAVYSIPVLFGPNFSKFIEAKELIKCKGGFSFDSKEQLEQLLDSFMNQDEVMLTAGKKAGEMVKNGSGGTIKILDKIQL
ncbi:MAG: glycosyltransferase N-terminal domain-containing protein [Bacteroidales bacterium]|nr:glycosyltransferase N-terminal domain-containing protein [Bacteroidales bacterium]